MSGTPNEQQLKHSLIVKYREFVAKRYDFDLIKDNPTIPPDITRAVVETVKQYFLEELYPEPLQRDKLDAAFQELANYVHHPAKVWGLLGNLAMAILRFGTQFPKALRAGMHALRAHTSAKQFENTLLQAAIKRKVKVPISDEQFLECIRSIPRQQLEEFINEVEHLFISFTDAQLLGKTILIMKDVLALMKKKSDLYGPNEVAAIQLGLDIMKKGYALFEGYDDRLKKDMIAYVINNEKKFLDELYNGD